jgi:hypothetical protein
MSYGQQDDVYGRLNNTRDVGQARFPFLEDGGRLALATLEEFQHTTHGPSARALLKVLQSTSGKHPVGSFVVKIWKLVKPPFKPGMTTEADEFADFCRKLKNAPMGHPIGNDIRVLMKERPTEQLARGTVIDATGSTKEYTKRDGTKAMWTNIYWLAVQQSPQDIAAMRQRLELEGIPSTSGAPAPVQPQYTAPVQPTYSAPQATAAAPQQGGFLSQIPPGPQGGNQGGNNGGGGSW